ncbi:rhodanese-like domain-containing protein [Desulfuribacillus alkaliarsenatis]|uniref:Rhodanese domain-containing protein n=1 Tax=Desulfuribacillus alkaliarsenatis TaxID=766136 RepID=A0A1E5G4T2_9FIRM|nr:rhodanese-like domain-containing protein [Desulfuribacillus alkaliarsenatis]OEF98173.1 hypothetical protein BHF68_00335 [Desulfuribacillus alkaliarsenatis]
MQNKLVVGIIIAAMLVAGFGIGFFTNGYVSGGGIGTAPDGNEINIERASINLMKQQQAGGYELVDTQTLKQWIDAGENVLIIDTMPASFHQNTRIPGAVNAEMPIGTMDDATPAQKEAFAALLGDDKSKKIVVYCGFVACTRSDAGAAYAVSLGYENVYRHPGGIKAWQDAGY